MKKLLSFIALFLISFILIACDAPVEEETSPLDTIVANLQLTFAEGDNKDSVTKNFTVVTEVDGATITWLTSSPSIISITGTNANVTRQDEDVTVSVTAIVSLDGKQKNKPFQVVVKAKEASQVEGELLYSFIFDGSELSHGYSDAAPTGNLKNQVNNSNFPVAKKRVNTAQGGEGLVLSGSSKSDTGAYLVFVFAEEVTKIEFEQRMWSELDVEQMTEAQFQVKVGANWVTLVDFLQQNSSASFVTFELDELQEGHEFRFFVNGNQLASDAAVSNSARMVVDNMKVYGVPGENPNPGDPNPGDPNPVNFAFTETFDGATALGANYGDGSYTAQGVTWTWVHAMNAAQGTDGNYAISGKSVLLRRSDEPSSLEGTFTNGLAGFSFEYRKGYTGGRIRTYKVDVTANGTTTTYALPNFGEGSGAQTNVYTFVYPGQALSGTVKVKIYAVGDAGNQQAVFDNFKWSNGDGSGGNGGGEEQPDPTGAATTQEAIDAFLAEAELTFLSKTADTAIYAEWYADYTLADYADAYAVDTMEAFIVLTEEDIPLVLFVGKTGSVYEVVEYIELYETAFDAIEYGSFAYGNEGGLVSVELIANDAALISDEYNASFDEPFTSLEELADYLQISVDVMEAYSATWDETSIYPGTDIFVVIHVGGYYIAIEWL